MKKTSSSSGSRLLVGPGQITGSHATMWPAAGGLRWRRAAVMIEPMRFYVLVLVGHDIFCFAHRFINPVHWHKHTRRLHLTLTNS